MEKSLKKAEISFKKWKNIRNKLKQVEYSLKKFECVYLRILLNDGSCPALNWVLDQQAEKAGQHGNQHF